MFLIYAVIYVSMFSIFLILAGTCSANLMNIVFVILMWQMAVRQMILCFVNFQLGQGVSFREQRKSTTMQRNFLKSVAKNVLFQSQRSWTCLKADGKSPAVVVNAKSGQKVLDVPRRFGGLAKIDIKGNGAHQKNMVGCTPTTCNFLLQSCCLATTIRK